MVPFEETIHTKQELIDACKRGFEDYSSHKISKNDFCMFFGFTHGEAITRFYEGNYEQLLIDGGFNTGSVAYFSGGINAWKNLRDGKYEFPPLIQHDFKPHYDNPHPLQQIFYGAPGTGKSHKIKDDADVKAADEKNLVFRTTFHPDSDYSTFVGAYKPTMKPVADKYKAVAGKDEEITYSFVPQAFLQAYVAAWNHPDDKVFLVIEEINRGNCAQIFGDLFQLLDRDDNGDSEYPIKADMDLVKYLKGKDDYGQEVLKNKEGIKDDKLRLPANMYIWATMNTSDQSLFPIDSAFKRRWDWQYMPISDAKKGWQIEANGKRYDWWQFLQKMNDKIGSTTNSEDKKLGYFFCKAKNGIINAETFVGKVVFYVWNDVFKDFAEETGNIFQDVDGTALSFNKFYTVGSDGRTVVVEDKVERLMQNLGVEPNNAESDFEDETNEVSLTVTFPDGTVIHEKNNVETYIAAVRKIGIERVYQTGLKIDNQLLVGTVDNPPALARRTFGNYYILSNLRHPTKIKCLKMISDTLNLNLQIDTV